METTERNTQEAEFILKINQMTTEELKELIDFMEWLKANKPTTEEATAEMERRITARQPKAHAAEYITPEEVKRIIWNHTRTAEVIRRAEYCKEIHFPEVDNSPIHQEKLTIAAIYEAGRIDGIRSERARRKNKKYIGSLLDRVKSPAV